MIRCPGDSCPRWKDAYGTTFEEKSKVCKGCDTCKDRPPLQENDSDSEDEIPKLVNEIERLIWLDNCKQRIRWERKEFIYFFLFQSWRQFEDEISKRQQFSLQYFIKNFKLI